MNNVIEIVIEYLKLKNELSDLESDILSTFNTFVGVPFDRKKAEEKIFENNLKHVDILTSISNRPGIVHRAFSDSSDEEVKNNLRMQLECLCEKEIIVMGMK